MRVGIYYSNKDIRIEEMPIPRIGSDELLVKVLHSGICGSDVMEWYRIQKAPRVLGHEIAGIIEQVGDNVKRFKKGDRVFVSHHVPCNTCHRCLKGAYTDCETLHTTNFDPGGFAEYVRIPSLQVDRGTFIIPDNMPLELGVFIEPLACVVRGQRLAGIRPGDSILVLGSGISGLLHIALAKSLGAGRIIASDVNEYRMNAAKKYGADYVFHADDDIPKKIKDVNDGRFVDIAIICTSAISAHEQAIKSIDWGGTVMLFGVAAPGEIWQFPVFNFWRNGSKMISSYGGAPIDIEQAIELIRFKRIDVQSMITHRLPLDDIQKGFDLVVKSNESIKVVIEPHKSFA